MVHYQSACAVELRWSSSNLPTALSSMMPWALVFAADMAPGLTLEAKNLRRNEMMGNRMVYLISSCLVRFLKGIQDFIG